MNTSHDIRYTPDPAQEVSDVYGIVEPEDDHGPNTADLLRERAILNAATRENSSALVTGPEEAETNEIENIRAPGLNPFARTTRSRELQEILDTAENSRISLKDRCCLSVRIV